MALMVSGRRGRVGNATLSVAGGCLMLLASRAAANIVISPVDGEFYNNPNHVCGFAPLTLIPAFSKEFKSLNFNPPLGLIPGTVISPSTEVFTNIETDADGAFVHSENAQGNNFTAGIAPMKYFFAALSGTISVDGSQQIAFEIYHDDSFVFGIDGDVRRVSGPLVVPPLSGQTALHGLPVVGAYGRATTPRKSIVVLQFGGAGEYPFEINYVACSGNTKTLTVFADDSAIQFTIGTPTPTPTQTGTNTPVPTTTPTATVTTTGTQVPHATGTPTGPPGPSLTPTNSPPPSLTPTRTNTPSPSPTPTATPIVGVALALGEAAAQPGATVTLPVDFAPGPNDGRLFGADEIAILAFTLQFPPAPNLAFDTTDANHDGIPDAIVFNPTHDPALNGFSLSVSAAAEGLVDIEIDANQDAPRPLPPTTLITIALQVLPRSSAGDFHVVPTGVHAFDLNATEYPMTSLAVGIIHVRPLPTNTPVPTIPIGVKITTAGGGCATAGSSSSASAPVLVIVAWWLGRRGARRAARDA